MPTSPLLTTLTRLSQMTWVFLDVGLRELVRGLVSPTPFMESCDNTSSDGPAILRPLYNKYFCHITIKKWSKIYSRTIRKCLFLLRIFCFGLISHCNSYWKFNLKFRPWEIFCVGYQCTKGHNKNSQPTYLDVFDKIWHTLVCNLYYRVCSLQHFVFSLKY